jgi:hypothetical protein
MKSNIFQEVLLYISEEKSIEDFTIDFYTNHYIHIITERVEKKYKELIENNFEVIVIGMKEKKIDYPKKPSMGNIYNLKEKKKKINSYIIENPFFYNIKNSFVIEPSEDHLFDSSITINFLDGYPLTSFFDCLLYGKECIYKYQNKVWTCRYRSDAAKMLKTTEENMLDLCICYGFKYYHNSDRKNIIDKYKDKKEMAKQFITDSQFEKIYFLLQNEFCKK